MLHNIASLITDFTYYQDYYNLCCSIGINAYNIGELVILYALDDNIKDMQYLIDRDLCDKDHYCKACIKYKAYKCLNMLCTIGYGKYILDNVMHDEDIDVLNFMINSHLICFSPSILLNNSLLEKIIDLIIEGTIVDTSIIYKLDQLGRYDLIDKVAHLYY